MRIGRATTVTLMRPLGRVPSKHRKILCALLVATAPAFAQDAPRRQLLHQLEQAMQAGQLDAARGLVESALASAPRDVQLLEWQARVAVATGDERVARRDFSAARVAYQVAIRSYEAAEAGAPRALEKRSYHGWGYALRATGQYRAAVVRLGLALEGNARDVPRLTMRAGCLHWLDDPLAALKDYERALHFAPDDGAAVVGRADVLLELGRHEEACRDMQERVDRLDEGARAQLEPLLRWLYLRAMADLDVEVAVAALEKLLRVRPENAWAQAELGIGRYRLGRLEEAYSTLVPLADVQHVVLADSIRGRVLAHLGLLALHRADNAGARAYFERALAHAPEDGTALQGWIGVLRRAGEMDAVRALHPRLERAVRREEDTRRWEKVLARSPRDRPARRGVIEALLDLRRWSEATERLAEFERWLPGDPWIEELQHELARRQAAAAAP